MKRIDFTILSRRDFELFYSNRRVPAIGKSGEQLTSGGQPKFIPETQIWLNSEKRKQFFGVGFYPDGVSCPPGILNLWRGWGCESIKGDCEPYLEHLRVNICGGDEAAFRYLVHFMADAVQNPADPRGVVVALHGAKGTGKSIAINEFGKIFGQHFLEVSDHEEFLGRFNGITKDVLILNAEEALWGGDKKHDSVLKQLVTGQTRQIEAKFQDRITIRNYLRIMMASNESWVVPATTDERRYFVVETPPPMPKQKQKEYFEPLLEFMDKGGREALFHYLKYEVDLRGVNLRDIPKTVGLQRQIMQGIERDPFMSFWLDVLKEGRLGQRGGWPDSISVSLLWDRWTSNLTKRRFRFVPSKQVLGEKMREYVGENLKFRARNARSELIYKYRLPALDVARRIFAEKIGFNPGWDQKVPPKRTKGGTKGGTDYDQ